MTDDAHRWAAQGVAALGVCVVGYPTLGLGFLAALVIAVPVVGVSRPRILTTKGPERSLYMIAFYSATLAAVFATFLPFMTVGVYTFWDALIWWR